MSSYGIVEEVADSVGAGLLGTGAEVLGMGAGTSFLPFLGAFFLEELEKLSLWVVIWEELTMAFVAQLCPLGSRYLEYVGRNGPGSQVLNPFVFLPLPPYPVVAADLAALPGIAALFG